MVILRTVVPFTRETHSVYKAHQCPQLAKLESPVDFFLIWMLYRPYVLYLTAGDCGTLSVMGTIDIAHSPSCALNTVLRAWHVLQRLGVSIAHWVRLTPSTPLNATMVLCGITRIGSSEYSPQQHLTKKRTRIKLYGVIVLTFLRIAYISQSQHTPTH